MIWDALQFVAVENRKHLEVPLPEIVDPVGEEVFAVSSVDDSLKTFLEDDIRLNRR